jgi:hypothetical protein
LLLCFNGGRKWEIAVVMALISASISLRRSWAESIFHALRVQPLTTAFQAADVLSDVFSTATE